MRSIWLGAAASFVVGGLAVAQPASPQPPAAASGTSPANTGSTNSPAGSSTNAGATTQSGAGASGSADAHAPPHAVSPHSGSHAKHKSRRSKQPPAARSAGAGSATPGQGD